jgi:hypothetical protein
MLSAKAFNAKAQRTQREKRDGQWHVFLDLGTFAALVFLRVLCPFALNFFS